MKDYSVRGSSWITRIHRLIQSRERRERELAEAAINPVIAEIHREMAQRYSELIRKSVRSVPASR